MDALLTEPLTDPLGIGAADPGRPEPLSARVLRPLGVSTFERKGKPARRGLVSVRLEDGSGTLLITLWEPWAELGVLLWDGARLNLFGLTMDGAAADGRASAGWRSWVVVEPDQLIDASELAACDAHPAVHVLNKLVPRRTTSAATVHGRLVNALVPTAIAGGDFDPACTAALAELQLDLITLHRGGAARLAVGDLFAETAEFDGLATMRENARQCTNRIGRTLAPLVAGAAGHDLETTYLAPEVGLQGRLDLRIDGADGRRHVVEIKAGKAPGGPARQSHAAQVHAYDLMLRCAHGSAGLGDRHLLYAQDDKEPLRDASGSIWSAPKLLMRRNLMVAFERDLCLFDEAARRRWIPRPDTAADLAATGAPDDRAPLPAGPVTVGALPKWLQPSARELASRLTPAPGDAVRSAAQAYYAAHVGFIERERQLAKAEFSHLWRHTPDQKAAAATALVSLRLVSSDPTARTATFGLASPPEGRFRSGDALLLYELTADGPTHGQLHKAGLARLDRTSLTLAFRHGLPDGLADPAALPERCFAVEPDYLDVTSRRAQGTLYGFLGQSRERQARLLGLRPPRVRHEYDPPAPLPNRLNDEKLDLLRRIQQAEDYLLVQGPPGTGKTELLVQLVVELLRDPTERLLISTFTNRALDNLLIKLRKRGVEFIRLGNAEATDETLRDALLARRTAGLTPADAEATLTGCRVFAATTSTAAGNPVFELLDFTTAIIDEASQLTEPAALAAILPCARFVMVGDECQLPAVSRQGAEPPKRPTVPGEGGRSADPALVSLGAADLRDSLFERLKRRNEAKGWPGAAMLTQQFRMNERVLSFANRTAYDGRLNAHPDVAHSYLQADGSASTTDLAPDLAAAILSNDAAASLICVESAPVETAGRHVGEARTVASATALLLAAGVAPGEIGIIAPFRAQLGELRNALETALDGPIPDGLTLDTVERFQGMERDVILISATVGATAQLERMQSRTADGRVDRKLNVALTRAKQKVIFTGCPAALLGDPIYADLLTHFHDHGLVFQG